MICTGLPVDTHFELLLSVHEVLSLYSSISVSESESDKKVELN
jgi:hypothetical protein